MWSPADQWNELIEIRNPYPPVAFAPGDNRRAQSDSQNHNNPASAIISGTVSSLPIAIM